MTQDYDADEYVLPDIIRNFITYFSRMVAENNVYEINSIYEDTWNKLTDRYFSNAPWPPPSVIEGIVSDDDNPIFVILYKELYYRHIYSKLQPNLHERIESWENYCDLFAYLLQTEVPVDIDLPNQWLWDMVDEFIYQFQSFCQYRSKLKNKSADELTFLKDNTQTWDVTDVVNYLHALITKSNILVSLQQEHQGETPTAETVTPFGVHHLYKMLGYFSIISLARVHCLLADYHLALKIIAPIDLSKKHGLFSKVTACHITLYYYLGFAYFMMRRYVDAIRAFSHILLYISRTRQYHTRSYQYEQILKKNEQMYALLAMAVSLCPYRIDEAVHSTLRDRYGDKMLKMQRLADDNTQLFEELFTFACPKFIIPSPPNYDDPPQNYSQDAYRLQLKMFLQEVRQQKDHPTIRSYLKLYTTISCEKMCAFTDQSEYDFKTQLMCLKHKSRNIQWAGGPALDGQLKSTSDVDFFVVDNVVHVSDTKVATSYTDFFVRHIHKLEDIQKDLTRIK